MNLDELDRIDPLPQVPGLELALEVRLRFAPFPKLPDVAQGGSRSYVRVQEGAFRGPTLSGTVLEASGGDYATFRPDGVVSLDARYLLQEADGTMITLMNRGFVWGRSPDVMPRFSRIANGQSDETVSPDEYYFRTMTTFEVPVGPHDWLTRHVFVGAGARLKDGNYVRYYKLT